MDYLDLILAHWPFLMAAGILYVFTKALKEARWFRAVRRWIPLPFFPIALGAALGLIPGIPVSVDVANACAGPSLYFAGAGVLAVVWKDAYKEWGKPLSS